MAIDLTTYEQLVTEFAKLNASIRKFVNGTKEEIVQTDSGPIKTLSGLVDSVSKIRYTQKLVEYPTMTSALLAIDSIESTDVVKVDALGLYQKDAEGQLQPISYSDIYDLKDVLPDPWNYNQVLLQEDKTNVPVKICSFNLPTSNVQVQDICLEGSLKYNNSIEGFRGVYYTDFRLSVVTGNQDEKICKFECDNAITTSFDNNIFFLSPRLDAVFNSDALTHQIEIWFYPPTSATGNVAGKLDLRFNGVNTKQVKFN